ncbi:MAG: DUF4912 domain-containing protein, partial [Cyanobacteria bacterium SBLK]|nr:DUF4912 domain-containing protein [Cyanobacteria bacterium SBLK]
MANERLPLEEMTLRQLRKVASKYNISRYSRMRKAQLLAAIREVAEHPVTLTEPAIIQPVNSHPISPPKEEPEVEASKFQVGQQTPVEATLASVDEGLAELPGGYGESVVVLMPRDPQWCYAYWDIPNDRKEELRRQGGQQLALRIYDVTNVKLETQNPHSVQEYPCDELAREWYIPIPVSDRDYCVEIGYRCIDGRWLILARSSIVRVPPIYPSDWIEDQFATVSWEQELAGKKVLQLSGGGGGEAIEALYERESERISDSLFGSMQQVPEEGMSSYVFPSGVGKWASGAGMSGAGMSGIGMKESGAGMQMSGAGMTSGMGLETMSGAGMTSGMGLETMSGAGMTSGMGLETMSGAGMQMSGVGISGMGMQMSGAGISGMGLETMSGVGMTSGMGLETMSGVGMMSGVGLVSGAGMQMSGAGISGMGMQMSGTGISGMGLETMSGVGMMSGMGLETMSGVGMMSGMGMQMSGAGISGMGMQMSGAGISGMGLETVSGVGMMSGMGMQTMSGVGMMSGVGLVSGAGMQMSGAGISGMGMQMSGAGISGMGMQTMSGVGMMSGMGMQTMSGVGMMSGMGMQMSGAGISGMGMQMSGAG